jgi:protein-S-isoprenylcysteine O-methyltransferase Ste14
VQKSLATAGSALFFCLAPGTVAGFIPWWISDWEMREPFSFYLPIRIVGGLLILASASFLLNAFARFVREGLGTPAPVAPTAHLVVGGVYRYVRNPMYLAIDAIILGQALLLGQVPLLWYFLGITVLQMAFVHLHEEPVLRRRFGTEYDTYRRAVPAWRPLLRPWQPPEPHHP